MEDNTTDYNFKEEALPFIIYNEEIQGNIHICTSNTQFRI